jgi:UDP-glucose 4-epimerase
MTLPLKYFVTGGAGFVGSHVTDRLLRDGHYVTVFDNFATGRRQFLERAAASPGFALTEGDVLDEGALSAAMAGHDVVMHFAANADVRFGLQHPRKDLEQNTLATFAVLEAMRGNGISRIAFSSTGSVYGEPDVFPTPETCPCPIQTSLYGASKLACEGLIAAYCSGFGLTGYIFRFVSILGERYTHGHVYDFYRKLLNDPSQIEVLGNGRQRKSYLYIGDCVEAIVTVMASTREPVNIFNLGTQEHCTVDESLGWITEHLGVKPERRYTGGERGWVGDSPFIFLDTSKVRGLGWRPKLTIRQGILATLQYLQANPWVLSAG